MGSGDGRAGAGTGEQGVVTRLAHPPLGRTRNRVGLSLDRFDRELLQAPPATSLGHGQTDFGRLSFFSCLATRFSLSDLPGFLADGFWGDFSGTVAPSRRKATLYPGAARSSPGKSQVVGTDDPQATWCTIDPWTPPHCFAVRGHRIAAVAPWRPRGGAHGWPTARTTDATMPVAWWRSTGAGWPRWSTSTAPR